MEYSYLLIHKQQNFRIFYINKQIHFYKKEIHKIFIDFFFTLEPFLFVKHSH